MDGLSGWVKVPKGGKVKKGWKKLFLAFTQDKLLLFETEDNFHTDTKATFICDINCEIFVARSVSQNELIHANAKDIDMIFRIQTFTHAMSANGEVEVIYNLIVGPSRKGFQNC